jgi:hypothetical protein
MGMIGYKHPGITNRFRLRQNFIQARQEILSICLSSEYFSTLYPPNHDVVQHSGRVQACLSRHGAILHHLSATVNLAFYQRPPSHGVICWLYFLRWKIEKAFDCFKNDLGEKKAWATGDNALQIQGHCICIIYNFILFLSETVQKTHHCRDKKAEKKYHGGLIKRKAIAESQGRFIHPLLFLYRSISKISAQLIRFVRNHFFSDKPFCSIIPLFIRRLEVYL